MLNQAKALAVSVLRILPNFERRRICPDLDLLGRPHTAEPAPDQRGQVLGARGQRSVDASRFPATMSSASPSAKTKAADKV